MLTAPQLRARATFNRGMTAQQRRERCADVGHDWTITGAPDGTAVCITCRAWESTPETVNIEEALADAC